MEISLDPAVKGLVKVSIRLGDASDLQYFCSFMTGNGVKLKRDEFVGMTLTEAVRRWRKIGDEALASQQKHTLSVVA